MGDGQEVSGVTGELVLLLYTPYVFGVGGARWVIKVPDSRFHQRRSGSLFELARTCMVLFSHHVKWLAQKGPARLKSACLRLVSVR